MKTYNDWKESISVKSIISAIIIRSLRKKEYGKKFFIILLIITILLVNVFSFWVYINDDAYITFRYSKNFALGLGPVYNVGERVEGYTNFLWMLILSLGFFVYHSIDISLLSKIIGTLCSICTIFLMSGITKIIEELKEKTFIISEESKGKGDVGAESA